MIRGTFYLSNEVSEAYDFMNAHLANVPDAFDAMAVYAVVRNEADIPSGCGRLYLDETGRFTLDRVYVLPDERGQGLGDLLMRMLLFRAQELNAPEVHLLSPADTIAFFARYGLSPQGEMEADLRPMRALADEIDIEGSCCSHKKACAGCTGNCDTCGQNA